MAIKDPWATNTAAVKDPWAEESTWSAPATPAEAVRRINMGLLGTYSGLMDPIFGAQRKIVSEMGLPQLALQKQELSTDPAYQRGRSIGAPAVEYTALGMLPGGLITRTAAASLLEGAKADDTLKGAALGAALQGGGELAGAGAIKGFTTLADLIRPNKYLKEVVIPTLSGGKKTAPEIASDLASDITDSAANIRNRYLEKIQPVEDAMEGYDIYHTKTGFVPRNYETTFADMANLYLGDADRLHTTFIKNPTFKNAQNLQAQLRSEARSLYGGDVATRQARRNLWNLRNTLRSDIRNSLARQDISGDLLNKYNDASDFYKSEYVPYTDSLTIRKLLDNRGATPSQIESVFTNPVVTADDEIAAKKIAGDLGQKGRNKILALELVKKSTPEQALEFSKNLKSLELYKTKTLADLMKSLSTRQTLKYLTVGKGGVPPSLIDLGGLSGLAGLGYTAGKLLGNRAVPGVPETQIVESQ